MISKVTTVTEVTGSLTLYLLILFKLTLGSRPVTSVTSVTATYALSCYPGILANPAMQYAVLEYSKEKKELSSNV